MENNKDNENANEKITENENSQNKKEEMKEEINEIFFDEKINDDEMKKTYNQSIEILQTEDIFINQKEEIKRIKKKRMEVKNFNFRVLIFWSF